MVKVLFLIVSCTFFCVGHAKESKTLVLILCSQNLQVYKGFKKIWRSYMVSENASRSVSEDHIRGIARKFGKSVSSAATGQLRQFISYKSSQCGRRFVQVDPKFSTMTCSSCGAQSGPTGLSGLAVRQWRCACCGAQHDRDVNAAINTLLVGAGIALERQVA